MEENTRCFNMASAHKTQKASEDKKLELRLGPPGETFLGYKTNPSNHGAKRVLQHPVGAKTSEGNWFTDSEEKQCKKFSCYEEEAEKVLSFPWLSSSLRSSTFHREAQKELQKPEPSFLQSSEVEELQYPDKMACSTPASASFPATTDGTDSCHKRCALAPVVGWPPIRSFRKNIASSSISKMVPELPNKTPKEGSSLNPDSFRNDLFVKINMEGVPIGRKINLKAYDSYDKLSVAIDELFRGFLPAQRDTGDPMSESKMDEAKENESSVSGSREYTLVYEDNEGDRVLVGDVPWHMFVSTARRLRVLKSTEKVSVGVNKQEKTPLSGAIEL
ncbi:AUXIN-RESPONSIVE PROTEIN [Salix purpurea]|uniref:Auxin-responsive protein n=1 Tax=Salix purpurea TaxID=77065 RepID=A0A9Q0Q118_SALPP|nr:AUXIN-RESPONSIVE PROTEIN [Salix purpurea]